MLVPMQGWIFDLDGTLVESLPGIAASLNRALASHGFATYGDADVRRFIGDGVEMLIRRALPQAETLQYSQVLDSFRKDYAETWQHGTEPYEGIRALLESLQQKGVKLAVLSNKPHAFTERIVATLFPQQFDVVLGQRAGIPHKPDPAGLWEILRHPLWHESPSCLIGDSVMDVQTAQAAGIDSIAVSWGYHDRSILEATQPTWLVDGVAELAQLANS